MASSAFVWYFGRIQDDYDNYLADVKIDVSYFHLHLFSLKNQNDHIPSINIGIPDNAPMSRLMYSIHV